MNHPRGSGPLAAILAAASLASGCVFADADADSAAATATVGTTVRPTWSVPFERPSGPAALIAGNLVVRVSPSGLRAVDGLTGEARWRHDGNEFVTAGDRVVVLGGEGSAADVLDARTGAELWRSDRGRVVVRQDAVFVTDCAPLEADGRCRLSARAVSDGRRLWLVKAPRFAPEDTAVGAGTAAPERTTALVGTVRVADRNDFRAIAVDTSTGRPLPAGPRWQRGPVLVVGDALVLTGPAVPDEAGGCRIAMTSTELGSGRTRWSAAVHTRAGPDGCDRLPGAAGRLMGSGSRVVAHTPDGRPELFDLNTGRQVWTGDRPGDPLAGDDRSLLVRRAGPGGELALLDLDSGRTRWTTPSPGTVLDTASVTGRLVAVQTPDPAVQVYDVSTGRSLGRYPGTLVATTDDRIIVSRSDEPRGDVLEQYRPV